MSASRPLLLNTQAVGCQLRQLDDVLKQENLPPVGEFVEVTVPDTLDLAARAELSLNALTRNSNPDDFHTVYETFRFGQNPPVMGKPGWFINPANSLCAALRTNDVWQPGRDSTSNIEMMKAMLGRIQPDGLMTFPNDAGWPAGTSVPNVNGQLAMALLNWYERDKNRGWLDYVKLLCSGLDRTAIPRPGPRVLSAGERHRRGGHVAVDKPRRRASSHTRPPDEPESEQQGYEGSAKWMTVAARSRRLPANIDISKMHDCSTWECGSRDSASRGRCGRGSVVSLIRATSRAFSPATSPATYTFSTRCSRWGMAAEERSTEAGARQGYELTRRVGIMRMGWYPSWIINGAETYGRSKELHGVCDSSGIAAALMLAVKLSDAGIGDYWDDVDYIVRNQLVEQQFTDADVMSRKAGGDPENLIARFVGGCGTAEPTASKPEINAIATADTAAAFYHAWHGITRFDEEAKLAQVNLFLNRVSPWLDVESYLPYEGKVILRNKQASTILVRLPMWLNDRLPSGTPTRWRSPASERREFCPARVGRNLLLDVQIGDVVELNFPVPRDGQVHHRRQGLPDPVPRQHGGGYRQSQHEFQHDSDLSARGHESDGAPMHTVQRFVADNVLPLSVSGRENHGVRTCFIAICWLQFAPCVHRIALRRRTARLSIARP